MARKNYFVKFYFGFIIVFIIAIITGLFILHSFLKTYESAQPQSIAKTIFDEYIKTQNFSELKEKYNFELSDYETDENTKKVFEELLSDKNCEINYSSQVPENSDICFLVKSNNKNIFSISLSKNKTKGKFGIVGYTVDKVEILNNTYKSVKINFPSNSKISINGKSIQEKDIKKTSLPQIKDVEFGKDAIYLCFIKINNLLSEDIKITVNDNNFNIEKNGNEYTVSEKFEDSFKQDTEDFALSGAKTYAARMQNDASLYDLSKYVDVNSDFYKNVSNTNVSFAWDHDGYDFENVKVSRLTKHSPDIYSCRVQFTQVLKLNSRRYRDKFDKQIYLKINENNIKIIDMQSVG